MSGDGGETWRVSSPTAIDSAEQVCSRWPGVDPGTTKDGETDCSVVESRPEARHRAAGGLTGGGFRVVQAGGEGG